MVVVCTKLPFVPVWSLKTLLLMVRVDIVMDIPGVSPGAVFWYILDWTIESAEASIIIVPV